MSFLPDFIKILPCEVVMEIYEPKIFSIGIFDSARFFSGVTETPPRTVQQYEIELFLSHGGVSCVGEECFPVRQGAVLLASPGDERHSRLPVSARFLRFLPMHPGMEEVLNRLPHHFPEDCTDRLLPFFLAAEKAAVSQAPGAGLHRLRALCDLVCTLDELAHREMTAPTVTDPAVRYMEEHYAEALSVAMLAARCHLSETHFHRLFLSERNMTPVHYLTEVRLLAARRMLTEERKPISEIALLCGFSSQAYFTYRFRRRYAVSPARYREEAAYRP